MKFHFPLLKIALCQVFVFPIVMEHIKYDKFKLMPTTTSITSVSTISKENGLS